MAALAAAMVVGPGAPARAADTFTCAGPGQIFAHGADGFQYRYPLNNPGTTRVEHGVRSGETGRSWTTYPKVIGGANGRIYGINAEGLWQYRWNGVRYDVNPANGTQRWQVSPSFTMYATQTAFRNRITVDEIGDIYLIDAAGALRWYRYDEANGVLAFNRVIDRGWLKYDLIVGAGPGVLYSRTPAGEFYRSRFEPVSQRWITDEQRIAASTWNNFTKGITSHGGDTLTGIQADGDIFHYRWVEDENRWAVPGVDFGDSWQNYANVYPLTDSCKLTDRKTPARPATPVQPDSATEAIQLPANGTALGPIEYTYTDGEGRLWHGSQSHPDVFQNIVWTPLATAGQYSGRPSLVLNPEDQPRLFAQSTTSDIRSFSRPGSSGSPFGPALDLGGVMRSRPVAVRMYDKSTALFALDTSGALWVRRYDTTVRELLPWRKVGGTGLTGELTVDVDFDGKVTLFALDADGTPVTATYLMDGYLSEWTGLGGDGFTATPVVVRFPGPFLQVFARAADGRIMTQRQDGTGKFPGTWTPLGDFVSTGPPVALLDPQNSRLGVFARGAGNEVFRIFETAAGSQKWGEWQDLNPDAADPAATDLSLTEFRGAAGDSYFLTFRNADGAHRVYVRATTSGKKAATPTFQARSIRK